MCGIAGIVSRNTALVQQQKLQSMATALQHRGPDGEGFWMDGKNNVGFAHRRLAIIDLSSTGAQPMHYKGRYSIVYNGEIYNYIELRNELKKLGHHFSTQSDTEVILAAYAEYGNECVQHLDGMFAFAIWDDEYQELFAARDRFGEKPFYYFFDGEQLVFASEMKALWAAGIGKETNNTMLLNYLTLGFVSNPANAEETFYTNIQKLPAASSLIYAIDDSDIIVSQYWDLDKEAISDMVDEQQIQQHFHELFHQSVKRRLRSDVAVGTSLSGGLDSSSIIAAVSKGQTNNPQLNSFSAIFPGFEKDESEHIAAINRKFNLQGHSITPTAEGLVHDFEKLVHHQEEPLQSASIYAQYKVYELARQHGITVLLDGQGADEVLGGYTKYYHWYWQELIAKGRFGLLKKERKAANGFGINVNWDFKNYLAAYMPSRAAKKLEQNLYKQQAANADIKQEFLWQNADKETLHKPIVGKLNDILYFNTMQFGLEELLRYADRNSMAHSREVRLPFLNHELVQFIFSLPSSCKIKNGFTKWILRSSMEKQLPESIIWRKDKIGFEPPQHQWMQHRSVRDMMHESRKKLVQNGILQPSILNKPLTATTAHAADNFDWRYLSAAAML
jgi:asparagine synthase (glutamine-hydrolysing)